MVALGASALRFSASMVDFGSPTGALAQTAVDLPLLEEQKQHGTYAYQISEYIFLLPLNRPNS